MTGRFGLQAPIPSEIHNFGVRLLRGRVELTHPAELDTLIKGGGGQPSGFKAWLADEDRRIRVTSNVLILIGRPNRHESGCSAIDR